MAQRMQRRRPVHNARPTCQPTTNQSYGDPRAHRRLQTRARCPTSSRAPRSEAQETATATATAGSSATRSAQERQAGGNYYSTVKTRRSSRTAVKRRRRARATITFSCTAADSCHKRKRMYSRHLPIRYIGSVHLLYTAYLSEGCSPHPVYYTVSVHLLCSAYLPGSYSPHLDLAVVRVSITYALSRTSLRQQEISHLSL